MEEVGPSLAEAVLKTLDLGFNLCPLEEELGDDEGLGHDPRVAKRVNRRQIALGELAT